MGKGIGNRREENCWTTRSTFEKALIISSLLPFIIFVLLVAFLIFQLAFVNRNSNSCTNPICQIEAKHLAQRIDTSTNPCNDFYQFSCGSLWKNQSQTSDPFSAIVQESKIQVMQVYNEPVKVTDYRIVKAAKMLYQSCLNTTEIKESDLEYIKKTVSSVGGWPVIAGEDWQESNFWWIETTKKLRQAGLFYQNFVDVSVVPPNEQSRSRFILKVSIPQPGDTQIKDINDFVEVAMALGAEENSTLQDYEEMYQFSLDIKRVIIELNNDDPPKKYTITEFQSMYEFINWKEFLNSIVGPTLKIQDDEPILFDSADAFNKWFTFLSKTSKRSQANYMIWKALENVLPFLQNKEVTWDNQRSEFCIQQVRDRFSPSPLDIVYVQRYLPDIKIALALDLVNNMKSEVLNLLEKCKWLDETSKQKARERLLNMTQIMGAPKSFLHRQIFFDMELDMDEVDKQDNCFLSNLLKTNKNYQSRVYQQLFRGQMLKWTLQTSSLIGDYYWEDNVINIPATILQGAIFNEARPKYVNYGSIGMLLSHHFFRILIGEEVKTFDVEAKTDNTVYQKVEEELSRCFNIQLNETYLMDILLQQSLGFQISYDAYKNSPHSKEDMGFGGYTANQLYWLSAASYFCQPDPTIAYIVGNDSETNLFSNLFLSSIASNKHFGVDFNCDVEAKMRSKETCSIF